MNEDYFVRLFECSWDTPICADKEINTEPWWNDNGREKLKYWEKNLSQCHFVQHKSDMDCLEIEPGLPCREDGH